MKINEQTLAKAVDYAVERYIDHKKRMIAVPAFEAGYTTRAAEEPSDEQVEAAAWALYGEDTSWGFVVVYRYGEQALAWDELEEEDQEMFRGFARRTLRAARDVSDAER